MSFRCVTDIADVPQFSKLFSFADEKLYLYDEEFNHKIAFISRVLSALLVTKLCLLHKTFQQHSWTSRIVGLKEFHAFVFILKPDVIVDVDATN